MFQFDKKHLAAALLHPQYRKLTFIDDYKRVKIHVYVRKLLVELQSVEKNAEQSNSTINSSEPMKKKHKSIEDQFVDPDGSSNEVSSFAQSSTSQKCDELDKYINMVIDDRFRTPNPLPFWQHYEEKLPNLAVLARRLFSIPATSANVERQFSAAGLLVNERRSSLSPETVEDVLFVRSVQKTLTKFPNLFST